MKEIVEREMQKEAAERRKRREERRKAERGDVPTEELSDVPTEELSDLPGERREAKRGAEEERKGETVETVETVETKRHAALYYWPIVPQERCKRWTVETATMWERWCGVMGRIPPPPPDVAEKDRLKIVKKNMSLWSLFKKLNRCDVC